MCVFSLSFVHFVTFETQWAYYVTHSQAKFWNLYTQQTAFYFWLIRVDVSHFSFNAQYIGSPTTFSYRCMRESRAYHWRFEYGALDLGQIVIVFCLFWLLIFIRHIKLTKSKWLGNHGLYNRFSDFQWEIIFIIRNKSNVSGIKRIRFRRKKNILCTYSVRNDLMTSGNTFFSIAYYKRQAIRIKSTDTYWVWM